MHVLLPCNSSDADSGVTLPSGTELQCRLATLARAQADCFTLTLTMTIAARYIICGVTSLKGEGQGAEMRAPVYPRAKQHWWMIEL